jgi:hypothetical protein
VRPHRARFDLAMLIETDSVERAEALRASASFRALETDARENARHVYVVTASNAKRIGTVDHTRDGVFLFNYFYADSPAQNLAAWDRLSDILPSLIFKRSFRDFVLARFDANDTAPMPILYKLATPASASG